MFDAAFAEPKFLAARAAKQHYFFGAVDMPLVTWDEAVDIIDKHIKQHHIKKWQHIRYQHPGGMILEYAQLFDKVKPLHAAAKRLSALEQNTYINSQAFVSLSSASGVFDKHRDFYLDNFLWQQIGNMDYTINDTETVHMKPGDLLYIPRNVLHQPHLHTPRVTISTAIVHNIKRN